jgi:hypothetical protein
MFLPVELKTELHAVDISGNDKEFCGNITFR